jgi:hypothetical protein
LGQVDFNACIKSNPFVCARLHNVYIGGVYLCVHVCVRVGIGESEQLGWSARTHSENAGGFHRRIRRVGVVGVHVCVCVYMCQCVSMRLNSCLHIVCISIYGFVCLA